MTVADKSASRWRWLARRAGWLAVAGCCLLAGLSQAQEAVPSASAPSPPSAPAEPVSEFTAGNLEVDEVTRRVLASEWLAAVAHGNQRQALRTAARLVETYAGVPADPYYLKIAAQRDIPASFFTGPFNRWDYQAWRHAYLIKQHAARVQRGTLPEVVAWFTAVCQTVAPEERPVFFTYSAWPYWILARGWGVCDRMCWGLAEMLYQNGYETQIIYLMDSAQRTSSHTILEVRNAQGKVWIADPFSGVLLPDYSVDKLAADTAKLAEIWPDKPEWQEQIRHSVFFTPSFPQDYCWRNQELQKVLRHYLDVACPRFGDDPLPRTMRYKTMRQRELGEKMGFTMGLWFYPIQLLRDDMYYELKGL